MSNRCTLPILLLVFVVLATGIVAAGGLLDQNPSLPFAIRED
jgi:hypothetical protein